MGAGRGRGGVEFRGYEGGDGVSFCGEEKTRQGDITDRSVHKAHGLALFWTSGSSY